MKTIIHSAVLLLSCLWISGCNDWLTVESKTTIEASKLVGTNEGIEYILTGVYLQLGIPRTEFSSGGVYSPDGTLGGSGIPEMIAATYTSVSEYWREQKYDYTSDMIQMNNNMFQNLYNVIANINPLINGMVEHKNTLNPTKYAIVRGEALAIRALLHLDLLRLYGPVPSEASSTQTCLPYVTVNDHKDYTYLTFDRYMELLLGDLDEAEQLLKEYDAAVTKTFAETENDSEAWHNRYRKSRLNYYGVLGLQARARLWMGDTEGALRYAKLVKEAKNEDGTPKISLTTENDFTISSISNDRLCYAEHLCGIKCESYEYGAFGTAWRQGTITLVNSDPDFAEIVFDGNEDDIRLKYLWEMTSGNSLAYGDGYYTTRFTGFTEGSNSPKSFPIMRLSEIYLIIMETGTLAEANAAYEEFCTARNIDYVPLTEADRRERVKKEYLREFMGEGQNFYTYKRFNSPTMWFRDGTLQSEDYVMPIPQLETL